MLKSFFNYFSPKTTEPEPEPAQVEAEVVEVETNAHIPVASVDISEVKCLVHSHYLLILMIISSSHFLNSEDI